VASPNKQQQVGILPSALSTTSISLLNLLQAGMAAAAGKQQVSKVPNKTP
jgi:hypothetical protein